MSEELAKEYSRISGRIEDEEIKAFSKYLLYYLRTTMDCKPIVSEKGDEAEPPYALIPWSFRNIMANIGVTHADIVQFQRLMSSFIEVKTMILKYHTNPTDPTEKKSPLHEKLDIETTQNVYTLRELYFAADLEGAFCKYLKMLIPQYEIPSINNLLRVKEAIGWLVIYKTLDSTSVEPGMYEMTAALDAVKDDMQSDVWSELIHGYKLNGIDYRGDIGNRIEELGNRNIQRLIKDISRFIYILDEYWYRSRAEDNYVLEQYLMMDPLFADQLKTLGHGYKRILDSVKRSLSVQIELQDMLEESQDIGRILAILQNSINVSSVMDMRCKEYLKKLEDKEILRVMPDNGDVIFRKGKNIEDIKTLEWQIRRQIEGAIATWLNSEISIDTREIKA